MMVLLGCLYGLNRHSSNRFPEPKDREESEEGAERNLKRQQWMEHMHQAGPGVSWQAIDQNTRLQKAARRSMKLDTLAGGLVTGEWIETGSSNQAGRTHFTYPVYDSNQLYVASSGGIIWKGPLGGNDWTPLNDNMHIPDINMVHKTGNRLLVASGTIGTVGFYYTDDEGQNWNIASGLGQLANNGSIERAVVANDSVHSIYLLARQNGLSAIYLSRNLGTSFTRILFYGNAIYGGVERFDIWTDYNGSGNVYMLENNNLYRFNSANRLDTISQLSLQNPGQVLLSGLETSSGTYFNAAISDNGNTDFYASTVNGTSWQFAGNMAEMPFGRGSFSASQFVPGTIYFGAVNCFRSIDGGAHWSLVNEWYDYYGDPANMLHADIDGINSYIDNTGNEVVYINTDGGTYTSGDQLDNVYNISLQNLYVSQYYSTYTHRTLTDIIYAGAQDQGFQVSTTPAGGPREFVQTISGDYGHIVSGDGGNSFWTVYPGFLMYYPNAVNSTDALFWDFEGSNFLWLPPLMEDPADPTSVYLAGGSNTTGSHIYHLSASGGSITYTELPYNFGSTGAQISAMAISPIDNNYWYVMTDNGQFYTSTDGGSNWTRTNAFTGPTGHYFYGSSIIASAKILGLVYIGGSGYTGSAAFVSNDNGQNFTAINAGLPPTLIYEMAINTSEDKIFAATEVGPYVYLPSENQWYDIAGPNVPDQVYWTVDYVPAINTARFGTYGRGIWDFVICDSNSTAPVAAFDFAINGATVGFSNQSQAFTYQWNFGNGITSTERSPILAYDSAGTYTVTLIASNGCLSDTQQKQVTILPSGIGDASVTTLQLYPNPGHGHLYIGGINSQLVEQVTVYDISGKVIFNRQVQDRRDLEIYLPPSVQGLHLVNMRMKGGKEIVRKLVVY
jgi:PKD repeat protein